MTDKNQPTLVQRLSYEYTDLSPLRALMQAIPYAGGSLDTLMAHSGQKFKEQRIENLIKYLTVEIQKIREDSITPNINNEELHDMILFALEQSSRTRSDEKRKRFAKIIANQIASPINWDTADSIIRIISNLSEPHIKLLQLSVDAPFCEGAFHGLKVITLSDQFTAGPENGVQPTLITRHFPNADESLMKLLCMELVGMGLFKDEGVNRTGIESMTHFVATGAAKTLVETIKTDDV